MSLLRVLTTWTLDASASPTGAALTFTEAQIALYAHGQGATHALQILDVEPGYPAVVLAGVGGDYTQSLFTTRSPFDRQTLLPYAVSDADESGSLPGGVFHPALTVLQTFYDGIDPVNYGRFIHQEASGSGHHVFLVIGHSSRFVPDISAEALAVAGAFTVVTPATDDYGLMTSTAPLSLNRAIGGTDRTIGTRQYAPTTPSQGHEVHRVEARTDILRFLTDALSETAPRIGG